MKKEEIIKRIKGSLGKDIKNFFEKSYKRAYIDIASKDLLKAVTLVYKELGARFNTASCLDLPDNFEILYHFTFDKAGLTISLRVDIPKKKAAIESITPMMKGAEWIEREIHELFGVDFINHPNLERLLLPDDWPEGVYPLRKDYKNES